MGELLLKIGSHGPDPAYQDGDIVVACNNRAMLCCHAQMICHPRTATRNRDGLIVAASVAKDWCEKTHEFRFERVSASEVDRVTIATANRERIGPTPNGSGEYIDVELFLARRKRKGDHRIFGTVGAEVWYGGRKDFGDAAISNVWDAIEAKTGTMRSTRMFWPWTRAEMLRFLPIKVDDFSDAERAAMQQEEYDNTNPERPILAKRRRHRVNWRSIASAIGTTKQAVLDGETEVDGRGVQLLRRLVVEDKP